MRVPRFRKQLEAALEKIRKIMQKKCIPCNLQRMGFKRAVPIIFYGVRSFENIEFWKILFNWLVNGDGKNFCGYKLRALNKGIGKFSERITMSPNGVISRVSENWYTLRVCGFAWQLYMIHKMCLHNRRGQECDSLIS